MINIDYINDRLLNIYGRFAEKPTWRVVFSDDQFEIRHGEYSKFDNSGNFLGIETGYKEVPKYRQWIKSKYVLERLVPVPAMNLQELTTLVSYEPVWVFEDKEGNPLPPKWEAIEFVINRINEQAAKSVGAKYKDPRIFESDPKIAMEAKKARLEKVRNELFGNETSTTDALAFKTGVTVPNNYGENNG